MAAETNFLQNLTPLLLFVVIDQVCGGGLPIEISGKRKTGFVFDHTGVRRFGMGVGINQTKNPPGKAIVHLMSPLRYDIALWSDNQADMAGGTGRCSEIFAHCPGNFLEIPLFADG
jgi:hypothetical protein